jgi:signal peptidase II
MIIYVIAAVVLILDQTVKFIIQMRMIPGHTLPIINNIFHLTYVQNTGAAFGIMAGRNFFFAIISLLAIVLVVFLSRDAGRTLLLKIAWGLILGGIIGNLIDRVRLGYVVDFLDFQVWPVFNIADSAITVGATLLIIKLLKSEKQMVK